MKLSEIYKIADSVAPKCLSDEYCEKFDAYDNSGILIDCGEDIHGVLFTLDLSYEAIEKALQEKDEYEHSHHRNF